MPRISTTQANLANLSYFLRNQSALSVAQEQVATGKKAASLKGLVNELGTLNAAQAVMSRSQGTLDRIAELEPKLAVQDTAIGQIANAANQVRQNLIESLGLDNGQTLMQNIQSAFDQVAGALNQKFAGRALFAGTRTDNQPFTAKTLDELGAAATVAELFTNSNVRPVSRIDDGETIETGFLASDIASELVTIMKNIKDYNDGANGPFAADLSDAQRTFINDQLAAVIPALDKLYQTQSENGLLQNRVEVTKTQEQDRQTMLTGVIGDLQDADLAEAASRLQQAQAAVEASARTFSVLSKVSLMDFLR